ncbi:hypothetical protein OE88DRAFT_263475 [Heliocybe sulcata]|uniref:Uncharacterized protein n=1 Tax=Heliocybe sulcata TaxID=5364 RepID=A0A5C3N267_9AGAM|nr:hypothetical protein OE88DRAFT_263475 [Heliocybe sulcata]
MLISCPLPIRYRCRGQYSSTMFLVTAVSCTQASRRTTSADLRWVVSEAPASTPFFRSFLSQRMPSSEPCSMCGFVADEEPDRTLLGTKEASLLDARQLPIAFAGEASG